MTAHAATFSPPVQHPPAFSLGRTFIANGKAFKADSIGFLQQAAAFNDISFLNFGVERVVLVNDPAAVQHVLVGHAKNYSKDTRGYRRMRYIVGNGLLTSNGSFWLRQRRIAQPAFHRRRLANMIRVMQTMSDEHMDGWSERAKGGAFTTDLSTEMMRLTMRIVGMTLLGVDTDHAAGHVSDALGVVLHRVNDYINSMLPAPAYWPSSANVAFWRARRALDKVVLDIIAERRARGEAGDDLLGMLMETQDEDTGERMTDGQLKDEVMTMFLAGHETTANALTWTMALLGENPKVRAAAIEEAVAVDEGDGGMPPKLDLIPRVFDESLRMKPPAWLIGRAALQADRLGDYDIVANQYLLMSPALLHRHPDYWTDPDRFDPERFVEGREIAPGSYIPFIAGPRQCIGKAFAKAEAQIILHGMLKRFDVELTVPFPKDDPSITLRPAGDVMVRVKRRA